MKIVCVASSNPVKLRATREGFERMYPGMDFEIRSTLPMISLPQQPSSDIETLQCAMLRAHNIRELAPGADYWVGIEGGVEDKPDGMVTFAWVVVLDSSRAGRGKSGEFFLPEAVAQLVRQGMELGNADDKVFSRNNSKQGDGAVGLLTANVIDRAGLYTPAVIFALIPFKNTELYP